MSSLSQVLRVLEAMVVARRLPDATLLSRAMNITLPVTVQTNLSVEEVVDDIDAAYRGARPADWMDRVTYERLRYGFRGRRLER